MKSPPTDKKLRGGYYTPEPIADFLTRWAIRSQSDRVLEPSCGDGVFIDAAARRLLELRASNSEVGAQLFGFEIEKSEARAASARLRARGVPESETRIQPKDFFEGCTLRLKGKKFDVVLGNPPFIRYQNFPEKQRTLALEIMRNAGLKPNKLTNIWVPFIVGAALLLKPEGRLAMVVPAELLQVNYAAGLRLFLSEYFRKITVLTFRRLAFDGIQQEVVLLLAERTGEGKGGIEVLELEDISKLSQYRARDFGLNGFKSVDHSTEKWTQYFLSSDEIDLIRTLRADPRLTKLGEIAGTDIGVVTGNNDFFLLNSKQTDQAGLGAFVSPLVCRSNHLPGLIFRRKDWRENARSGLAVNLIDLHGFDSKKLPREVRKYIEAGEDEKIHLGYKCRIRKFWYAVPSVYASGGFLLRQIHHYPKLVVNETLATCTDTIHRVQFRNGADRRSVAAAFINTLTFAFAELLGRSYGGGVLELEPNEADKLPIPLLGAERLDPERFDLILRSGSVDQALEITDHVLLQASLGLNRTQISMLHSIWRKLQARRLERRNGSSLSELKLVEVGG